MGAVADGGEESEMEGVVTRQASRDCSGASQNVFFSLSFLLIRSGLVIIV